MGLERSARVWSWAANDREVAERRKHADRLVGQQVVTVRYLTIDYQREELHPELVGSGPRLI